MSLRCLQRGASGQRENRMSLRILYAGDSPVGGAANYLLGILNFMKADVKHLPPSEKLNPGLLKNPYDVIIFSDFSASQVPAASQDLILDSLHEKSGFLMIGGWGSFSGPFGGW